MVETHMDLDGSSDWQRNMRWALFAALIMTVGLTYQDTFAAIMQKWESDASFSHGVLILPVSLWLAWLKRRELAMAPAAPSWWGALAMTACVAVWLVARGTCSSSSPWC